MAKEKGIKETRGARLKRLRKEKNFTLEEVSQKTKIHIRILKALEEDAVDEIAPAYLKGLLKIYCTFLRADPSDFIEEHVKEKILPPPPVKSRINISVIKKQIKPKPVIIVICLLILSITTFKFAKRIINYRALRLKEAPSVAESVPKSEAPSSLIPATNKLRLGIRSKEDCWLEVKLDGKTILNRTLKKGRFEEWVAKEKIEFSVGNAGGIEVEVNGESVSPLGRRRQVIKNMIITKEGLTVPK